MRRIKIALFVLQIIFFIILCFFILFVFKIRPISFCSDANQCGKKWISLSEKRQKFGVQIQRIFSKDESMELYEMIDPELDLYDYFFYSGKSIFCFSDSSAVLEKKQEWNGQLRKSFVYVFYASTGTDYLIRTHPFLGKWYMSEFFEELDLVDYRTVHNKGCLYPENVKKANNEIK